MITVTFMVATIYATVAARDEVGAGNLGLIISYVL
jgi:hypothetical protein